MRIGIYALALILLFACNNQKTEAIQLNDLIDGAENDTDTLKMNEVVPIVWYDSLSLDFQKLTDSLQLNRASFQKTDTVFFVDRFKHKKAQKIIFDSLGLISYYTYSDTIDTKNAFFNWLDCFGKRCNCILLFEEKRISNTPFVLIVTEKHILYMEFAEFSMNKKSFSTLESVFGKEQILFFLEQPKGKKSRWWQKSKEEWYIVKNEK
jgi:hypothetical protein